MKRESLETAGINNTYTIALVMLGITFKLLLHFYPAFHFAEMLHFAEMFYL